MRKTVIVLLICLIPVVFMAAVVVSPSPITSACIEFRNMESRIRGARGGDDHAMTLQAGAAAAALTHDHYYGDPCPPPAGTDQ